jgi:hypothetical protein
MDITIEEALRAIGEKAAVLRYLGDAAVPTSTVPDSAVLRGIGTLGAEIETLTARVKEALDALTLDTALPRP